MEVYRRLKDLVRERGLKATTVVTRTGCLRHCSLGTTVVVWPLNIWYGGVAPEDTAAILDASLRGESVARLEIPETAPWE